LGIYHLHHNDNGNANVCGQKEVYGMNSSYIFIMNAKLVDPNKLN
jgi:hypothetical protein